MNECERGKTASLFSDFIANENVSIHVTKASV